MPSLLNNVHGTRQLQLCNQKHYKEAVKIHSHNFISNISNPQNRSLISQRHANQSFINEFHVTDNKATHSNIHITCNRSNLISYILVGEKTQELTILIAKDQKELMYVKTTITMTTIQVGGT